MMISDICKLFYWGAVISLGYLHTDHCVHIKNEAFSVRFLCVGGPITVGCYKYSQPFNKTGLSHAGPLMCGVFLNRYPMVQ